MSNKIKLLTLGDSPMCVSGVGTQCRNLFEGLIKTGKYQIFSLGGAIQHQNYQPMRFSEFGEDFTIFPQNGYGSPDIIRQMCDQYKIDAIHFTTDPRFYGWLFDMAPELQARGIPLLYWTIWDAQPTPVYNMPFYQSCDYLGCISKLTTNVMTDLEKRCGLKTPYSWIPHAVDENIFKRLNSEAVKQAKIEILGAENAHKFIVFYNSRNARRKMTADVLAFFKTFLDQVGHQNAMLFMHTDPKDNEGSDLNAVADMLGLKPSNLKFSSSGQPSDVIARYYNISDVTINISNNEGWGLSCHESLSCGVPAIVTKTGGLQDQIIDDLGNEYGVCIPPATRSIQGSQQIPYIYDDRVCEKDVVAALNKMYKMPQDARRKLGAQAAQWIRRAFPMKRMIDSWDTAIQDTVKLYKDMPHRPAVRCAAL